MKQSTIITGIIEFIEETAIIQLIKTEKKVDNNKIITYLGTVSVMDDYIILEDCKHLIIKKQFFGKWFVYTGSNWLLDEVCKSVIDRKHSGTNKPYGVQHPVTK